MRNYKDDINMIIKFAKEFNVPCWITPYDERKTLRNLYILYEICDGDLVVSLYKYKEDEDFDGNDLVKSISIGIYDTKNIYEKLDEKFGDIINSK